MFIFANRFVYISPSCFYFRDQFDQQFPSALDADDEFTRLTSDLLPALDVYHAARRLFLIFHTKKDKERFERLCKYIVASLQSESVKLSYVGVFLIKEHRYKSNAIIQLINNLFIWIFLVYHGLLI